MNKNLLGLGIIMMAFVLGYSVNNIAISNPPSNYRVAVVDIQKVVTNSKEIKALKLDQEKQLRHLQATVEKAKLAIASEQDPEKIAKLEDKYREEINRQKISIDTSYNGKLNAIDNKIKTAVVEKARSMNYDIVLPKNAVLFGGDDITEDISKILKL